MTRNSPRGNCRSSEHVSKTNKRCDAGCWLRTLPSSTKDISSATIGRLQPSAAETVLHRKLQSLRDVKDYLFPRSHVLGPQQTRILRLHPGTLNDPLRADLLFASFGDAGLEIPHNNDPTLHTSSGFILPSPSPFTAIKHTALSYTWGDGNKDKNENRNPYDWLIVLHGGSLYVGITENLWAALKVARDRTEQVYVWADALCVNQFDPLEKEAQVGIKYQVFHQADRVLAWTGYADDHETATLLAGFIPGLLEQQQTTPDMRTHAPECVANAEEALTALSKFVQRPWFKRVWVRSEVFAAAERLVLRCGGAELGSEHFAQFDRLPERWNALFPPSSPLDMALASCSFAGANNNNTPISFPEIPEPIHHLCYWHSTSGPWLPPYSSTLPPPSPDDIWLRLLASDAVFRTSDPRDRIAAYIEMARFAFSILWPRHAPTGDQRPVRGYHVVPCPFPKQPIFMSLASRQLQQEKQVLDVDYRRDVTGWHASVSFNKWLLGATGKLLLLQTLEPRGVRAVAALSGTGESPMGTRWASNWSAPDTTVDGYGNSIGGSGNDSGTRSGRRYFVTTKRRTNSLRFGLGMLEAPLPDGSNARWEYGRPSIFHSPGSDSDGSLECTGYVLGKLRVRGYFGNSLKVVNHLSIPLVDTAPLRAVELDRHYEFYPNIGDGADSAGAAVSLKCLDWDATATAGDGAGAGGRGASAGVGKRKSSLSSSVLPSQLPPTPDHLAEYWTVPVDINVSVVRSAATSTPAPDSKARPKAKAKATNLETLKRAQQEEDTEDEEGEEDAQVLVQQQPQRTEQVVVSQDVGPGDILVAFFHMETLAVLRPRGVVKGAGSDDGVKVQEALYMGPALLLEGSGLGSAKIQGEEMRFRLQ